jgi:two-component system sensor histidine kinase PilS (NtrC family)
MSGLLTTDREHRITSFNPEAEHITGTPRERALGRDVEDVIPNVRSLFGEARGELPAARQRTRMAYRNALGEALYLGLASSPLRDADGTPTGYVLIFQDVTEVVAMEAELRRSERLAAVGKLAAHLAHEVRNPLAAISGSLQILQSCLATGEGDAERDRLMGIVLRETRRLDTLITDFLRYARPSEAKPERVALREFVDEFVEVFQASKPETVSLGVRVPEGLAAWVDAAQLRQVLWNLALNAVQAMPKGGALRLEARAVVPEPQEARAEGRNDLEAPGKGQVEISVSDSGSGMAPEVLDRILDPFFTTKSGGSGLGLATVHRIVEANHGTLRVESAPGRGSTFRIRLPAAGERA